MDWTRGCNDDVCEPSEVAWKMSVYGAAKEKHSVFLSLSESAVVHCGLVISCGPGCFMRIFEGGLSLSFFLFVVVSFLAVLCGLWNLSSPLGIKPGPIAVEVQSVNHWISKELPVFSPSFN